MNPYAPPTIPYAGTLAPAMPRELHVRAKWLRFTIGLYAFVTIAGISIAAYDIGSILASGPTLLLIGAILIVMAFRNSDLISTLLGLSAFALAALVVVLINLVPYSTTTGYWPLLTVFGVYSIVSVPYAGWLIAVRDSPPSQTAE